MTRRRIIATIVALGAIGSVAVTSPVLAYDRDAYSYAAAHMIQRSDIPKDLGPFKDRLFFAANARMGALYVCSVPQSDPNAAAVTVKIPGGKFSFTAAYDGRGKLDTNAYENVVQYASTMKAIKAFDLLKKRVSQCEGTGSDTWTGEDGTTTTYSTQLTNGTVPSVSTAGVESLFVSTNNLNETLPAGATRISDSYSVFSLFDDTIIVSSYFSGGTANLTTAQRKAVNQLAFNAEGRWVD